MSTRMMTSSVRKIVVLAGFFTVVGGAPQSVVAVPDDVATPETIQLTGVVRDFIELSKPGGHPDFEKVPSLGYGIYNGNVSPNIGGDNKPLFTGGGWLTKTQWKDSSNNPICYLLYDSSASPPDQVGITGGTSMGGVQSAESFNQWFNDVPGMNLSAPLTITLVKGENGNYVFDDKIDPEYAGKGGFFPIDGQLFGNSGGAPDHNFHFTFELHTQFTYYKNTGQVFKFIGDDDVFVYINGQLVIDLGGVHSAKTQLVDLDRDSLGLIDGQIYSLDFFFAERHRTQSNCRISTNLVLNGTNVPAITAAFD